MMIFQDVVLTLAMVPLVMSLPPNYEDMELAVDQAVGEKVDINQADPQSNAIHIAHNNPKDSDIKVVQSNPFNTTVHISLNVGTGAKVLVMMTNARNLQLHISFNGMSNSECEVEIIRVFNSSVHLSFQNPRYTPVKVTMDEAQLCSLHVSQNIPQNSPMEVLMSEAQNNQIHLTQAVPMFSPLTWTLSGDPDSNQIQVSQNAADDNSPLDCTPECPQEEYVYDYQYAASDQDATGIQNNQIEEVEDISTNQIEGDELPRSQQSLQDNYDYTDYQQEWETSLGEEEDDGFQKEKGSEEQVEQCPGGDLEACVDACPGEFGAQVFGFCVGSCGKRCP